VAQVQSVSPPVSNNPSVASRLLVAIEQRGLCEQQLTTGGEGQIELKNKITMLDEKIQLLEDIGKLKDEKIELYKSKEEVAKQMTNIKDKACADAVKAASPTFWGNMSKYLGGVGIGVILTVVGFMVL